MSDPTKNIEGLMTLRKPFPANQISKLPKPTRQQTEEVKKDFKKGVRCPECGGWHHPKVVHLDYVGHAALTDRLLDADPEWEWKPLAMDGSGLPLFDGNGGIWIILTVCGISRLGYGHPDGKKGGDAIKEAIGDALRNAAMRFGAALDLWHKGDLHGHIDEAQEQHAEEGRKPGWTETPPTPAPVEPRPQDIEPGETISEKQHKRLEAQISELGLERERVKELCSNWYGRYHFNQLGRNQYEHLDKFLPKLSAKMKKEIADPISRAEAAEKSLAAYLKSFDIPLAGDAFDIVGEAWEMAGKRHGEWPTDDAIDHANFFKLFQEEVDGRAPVACRDCDAFNASISAAKLDGWIKDNPRKPGPPAWVCPDCQAGNGGAQ